MAFRFFLVVLFVVVLGVVVLGVGHSFDALAADVKSFRGQYAYSNAGTKNDVHSCPLLPAVLQKKISTPGGLSKDEFEYLAISKGHNYLGFNSGRNFYHKKTNIILNEDEFIVHLNKLDHKDPANLARAS